MAWTGMTPTQIGELTPDRVNLQQRWYLSPPRRKGERRAKNPRPRARKHMTWDAYQAFKRFAALNAWGPFDRRSLRHTLERARRKVLAEMRKKHPRATLPHIRVYDLRHSFGTELYRRTQNLELVAAAMDHASTQMTKRYTLGAAADVLRDGMQAFERATTRRKRRAG